jgi:hypothetical protein
MSTNPRLSLVDSSARSAFGAIRGHDPELSGKFAEMYGFFWQQGGLDLEVKETIRLRNARTVDCGY